MREKVQPYKSVELPKDLVEEAELLMKQRHERRPVQVPLGLFIADLIRESLERAKAKGRFQSILEDYAVESDCIYIKDNKKDMIAELKFKDGSDLYCNIDCAKNCVHIGYAWSMPEVQKLISEKEMKGKE